MPNSHQRFVPPPIDPQAHAKMLRAWQRASRPWFKKKRWWVAGVMALLFVGSIGAVLSPDSGPQSRERVVAPQARSELPKPPEQTHPAQQARPPQGQLSGLQQSFADRAQPARARHHPAGRPETGQANALAHAARYLDFTAFSRSGLIHQLEFEGYTTAEATYGADTVGADWEEQAVAKATGYLELQSFSRAGLIDQLEYEGFTNSQAVHGVDGAGL